MKPVVFVVARFDHPDEGRLLLEALSEQLPAGSFLVIPRRVPIEVTALPLPRPGWVERRRQELVKLFRDLAGPPWKEFPHPGPTPPTADEPCSARCDVCYPDVYSDRGLPWLNPLICALRGHGRTQQLGEPWAWYCMDCGAPRPGKAEPSDAPTKPSPSRDMPAC